MYTQAQFFIGESAIYQGIYKSLESWNGWAIPFFTLETCKKMAVDPDFGGQIIIEGERVYLIIDDPDGGDTSREEVGARQHEGTQYYCVGGWSWCWQARSESDSEETVCKCGMQKITLRYMHGMGDFFDAQGIGWSGDAHAGTVEIHVPNAQHLADVLTEFIQFRDKLN
jgi:hypothetical protein